MKVKVCGMRDPLNILEVIQAEPDILGFIFYPPSKRFIGFSPDPALFNMIPEKIEKAGVFVDEPAQNILSLAEKFKLDYIQLHGSEEPGVCSEIKAAGFKVIKSFGVDSNFDFHVTEPFVESCNYFLFDTKSALHGGSGMKFDWRIAQRYSSPLPFFLSGGIGADDIRAIENIKNSALYAVDINSLFEIHPGIKDSRKVKEFITTLKFHTI